MLQGTSGGGKGVAKQGKLDSFFFKSLNISCPHWPNSCAMKIFSTPTNLSNNQSYTDPFYNQSSDDEDKLC